MKFSINLSSSDIYRRRFLQGLAALPLLTVLPACGFRLRGGGDYPFKNLFVNFSDTSSLALELRQNLLGTGRITLWDEPDQMAQADAVLDILSESREQVVVGVNASGQVRELQLRLSVKFRLRSPQGQDLIAPVELSQQRDLSFTETAALSKEIEQDTMYSDMQTSVVQQIMRRLAAVKPRTLPAAKP